MPIVRINCNLKNVLSRATTMVNLPIKSKMFEMHQSDFKSLSVHINTLLIVIL